MVAALLDRMFPNARSKEIADYEGQKYERRFTPLERPRKEFNDGLGQVLGEIARMKLCGGTAYPDFYHLHQNGP